MPCAEPFFFPGGKQGCLLVHGFTGTCNEMGWMGEYLHAQGFTVLGVRLAGHGTRPDDMLRVRRTDWVASVEDGLALLRGCTDQQFCAGLSMGGALTLYAAAHMPVDGIITISTPVRLPDWRVRFIRPLSRLMPRLEKGPPDWKNPEAAATHVEYPFYPTIALAELRDLLVKVRLSVPKIRVPALLVHSRLDASIPPENMQWIYDHLGSQCKEMLWVENSNHVVVREPDREKVFQAAVRFMRERCQ
jgi:carboxylesterase